MGIRGYVQVKNPEYGDCCLSSWVADQCVRLMSDHDVTIYEHNGDNDQWEIEINDALDDFVADLEKNPKMLDEYLSGELKNNDYGESLLALLKEGLEAAQKENMSYITVDWY